MRTDFTPSEFWKGIQEQAPAPQRRFRRLRESHAKPWVVKKVYLNGRGLVFEGHNELTGEDFFWNVNEHSLMDKRYDLSHAHFADERAKRWYEVLLDKAQEMA